MANKVLTYVDASVLIYAACKPTAATLARRLRALQVLGDPDREYGAELVSAEKPTKPLYRASSNMTSIY